MDFAPVAMKFGGIGSQKSPIIFTNVRVAEGGGMNMLQKLTTDGRLVIHGIRFDYNKATIKPESMGVLNEIAKLIKDNASVKFEIQGHTDSDGDDAYNMKLSQARAEAVKAVLVDMGIDASNLTPKGFGKSKPLSDNSTPEGKAINRRVEFVKL
jgi:OmpA-OmpF porin, OOP family